LKFKSVKSLKGLHRFILTGTPIQNRLIELWGLFDFLMPGYLYTEDLFKKHYEKLFEVNLTTFKEDELLFSDDQRKTLEKLHYKVMPFIMRRMKSEVLK
jgi:TATA-binding protein-associated factor